VTMTKRPAFGEGRERLAGAAEQPGFDADVVATVAQCDGNGIQVRIAFRIASTVVSCGAATL
jgi:hypothetical protein